MLAKRLLLRTSFSVLAAAGLIGGGAGWAQISRQAGRGSGSVQCIARFVNGTFTFVSTRGRVEGYDLRPTFYFVTSQFSGDGKWFAGYDHLTFTVLNDRLETSWSRATTLRNVTDLAVSPGGVGIAYSNRLEPSSGKRGIGVIGAASDPRDLATVSVGRPEEASIGWDADGKRIVFGGDGDIAVIRIDGRDRQIIGSGCSPSWSPDGRIISYRDNDGYGVIYDVGSGSSRRLSLARSHCAAFHWSPDSRLAFTDEVTGAPSRDCYTGDRFVIYRMLDGYRLGMYDPCDLRDGSFGWLSSPVQWRAVVRRASRPF
jgi:WD40-like Beta Propeller Repeat